MVFVSLTRYMDITFARMGDVHMISIVVDKKLVALTKKLIDTITDCGSSGISGMSSVSRLNLRAITNREGFLGSFSSSEIPLALQLDISQ